MRSQYSNRSLASGRTPTALFCDYGNYGVWQNKQVVFTANATNEQSNVGEPSVIYEPPNSPFATYVNTLSPAGVWMLNDSSGNAVDSSGNSRNLTANGTLTYADQGPTTQISKGISGWSTANYFSSTNSAFNNSGAFTMGFWGRCTNTAVTQMGIAKDNNDVNTNRAYELNLTGAHAEADVWNGSTRTVIDGSTVIANNTWYFYTMKYIPSTSLTVYVNGVQDGQITTSIPASINTGTAPFQVGTRTISGSNLPWQGQIAGVFFIPSAITDAQIKLLYYSGLYLTNTNVFKMWYTGGWTNPEICYAESADGYSWTKFAANPLVTAHDRSCVTKVGSTYYMYTAKQDGSAIDLYSCTDGTSFTLQQDSVLTKGTTGAWDANLVSNTFVWNENPTTWYMIYEAEGATGQAKLGLATSADGITWTKSIYNPVLQNPLYALGGINTPFVYKNGSTYWMWVITTPSTAGSIPTVMARFSSTDLINWTQNPLGATMSQETVDEGLTSTTGQLGDPALVEVSGTTYLYYSAYTNGGAATGIMKVATYPGTMAQLTTTRENAIDSNWLDRGLMGVSSSGTSDNNKLYIPAGTTADLTPNVLKISPSTSYTLTLRFTIGAGSRFQIYNYINDTNWSRIFINGNTTTDFQECIAGLSGSTTNLGANNACDGKEHSLTFTRTATTIAIAIDGVTIGTPQTLNSVTQAASQVAISTYNSQVSISNVLVS